MATFQFRTVPHIHAGRGSATELATIAAPLLAGVERVVLVTDRGVRQAGLIDAPLGELEVAGLSVLVLDEVIADPPEDMVLAATARARDFGAQLVIGFGGGSSLDTAKLVALLLGSDQPLSDMYGVNKVRGQRLPLILIPTTAGTGSEVTPISVVTVGETSKMGVNDPALYGDLAVLDAALTLGLPRHVTAATGIDAMVHAIEAYTSAIEKNPVSDALALAGLKKLHGSIERACLDGADMEAREDMLLGALLAGQAFANAPVGAVHALAYPLGGIFHVPHGLSNSLMLPPVLRYNAPSAEPLYTQLAAHLDLAGASTEALVTEMERIAGVVGIETRLSQVGVSHNDLPKMAEDAMKVERLLKNNPRPMTLEAAHACYESVL
ncbi:MULTISPECIES: iron-containing alcohol dehydrogenase [Maricaulis]|jgi:alcohol dehydrogenase class IV|uniref:Alcohol dehydrogenase 2 n=1 Tax=Maricaulis maris (strain MCS10) TaxID=394221 RepID=Q0AKS6_MARMM|nr:MULTISPECIES: iron-containing alcohol dehydrogenase [Maricaulis]ABI67117.1 iron-containing alcohol dehydrogenase [Maricaulis maris MCS10]MAC89983.1 alcohol dehydrogenase [Maricaulis sp.]